MDMLPFFASDAANVNIVFTQWREPHRHNLWWSKQQSRLLYCLWRFYESTTGSWRKQLEKQWSWDKPPMKVVVKTQEVADERHQTWNPKEPNQLQEAACPGLYPQQEESQQGGRAGKLPNICTSRFWHCFCHQQWQEMWWFCCCFEILLHWVSQKKKSYDSRSPSDTCCVAALLFLPKYRDAVSKIMTGTKDWAMQDQIGRPIKAF